MREYWRDTEDFGGGSLGSYLNIVHGSTFRTTVGHSVYSALVKMRSALANRIEDVDRAGKNRNWPGARACRSDCAVATDRTAAPPAGPPEDRQVLNDDKARGSWRIVIILVVVSAAAST